jgi:hypothetical protein
VNCGARFRLPRRFPQETFGHRLRGGGTECGARHSSDKGRVPHTPLCRMMSVTPFFEFVLVTVGTGNLAIPLTAVLLTARR